MRLGQSLPSSLASDWPSGQARRRVELESFAAQCRTTGVMASNNCHVLQTSVRCPNHTAVPKDRTAPPFIDSEIECVGGPIPKSHEYHHCRLQLILSCSLTTFLWRYACGHHDVFRCYVDRYGSRHCAKGGTIAFAARRRSLTIRRTS